MTRSVVYIVLAHKLPGQFARLVSRLHHPDDRVLAHVDAKADQGPFVAALHSAGLDGAAGVELSRRRVPVTWGGFGEIEAALAAVRRALAAGGSWSHIVLLSGQDYPVKPRDEIRGFLGGRNAGAAVAAESLILFLDADVVIGAGIIESISEIFEDETVNLVICPLIPLSDRRAIRACYRLMDLYLRLCNKVGLNQGVGSLIAVRKDAFAAVRGFDERIQAGEDAHFVRQVGHVVGGVHYSTRLRVPVSARRFDLESPVVFTLKVILWAALRLCGLRISILPYKWAPYITDAAPQSET